MAGKNKVTKEITTGIGTLSFPKIFEDTKGKKDDGTPSYEIQIIIPKTQVKDIKAILAAIQEVGVAQYGDRWKSVRLPLRDGDKEKDKFAEDGQTYGEKYPERLGCYFLNARSTRAVAVVGRDRSPIVNSSEVYGGCKGKIAVSFYPYNQAGNAGIGAGLSGVQKIADGEAFGGGAPPVDAMFDIIDGDEGDGFDDIDLSSIGDEDEKPKGKKADKAAKPKPKGKKGKKSKGDDDLVDALG